jgi:hypothetical protein
MNLELVASLGATRAPGESLRSWLRAGPLELSAWSELESGGPRMEPYCPRCYMRADGGKRWYTKAAWADRRVVVCIEHGLPLFESNGRISRLMTPALSKSRRLQSLELSDWIARWCVDSPCTPSGRQIFRTRCLQDQLLAAITGLQAGQPSIEAFNVGCWLLSLDGWLMSGLPRDVPRFQVASMTRQIDRFALVCLIWRLERRLVVGDDATWRSLALEEGCYQLLRESLRQNWPYLEARLETVAHPYS